MKKPRKHENTKFSFFVPSYFRVFVVLLLFIVLVPLHEGRAEDDIHGSAHLTYTSTDTETGEEKTLLFLLCNKVFSPQFTLWLLPFFVLLPMKRKWVLFYALEISNVLAFVTITYSYSHLESDTLLNASRAFVVVRHVVLACILFHALRWRSPAALGLRALKIPLPGRTSSPEQLGQSPPQAQEGHLRLPDIEGG